MKLVKREVWRSLLKFVGAASEVCLIGSHQGRACAAVRGLRPPPDPDAAHARLRTVALALPGGKQALVLSWHTHIDSGFFMRRRPKETPKERGE